jgi:ATP-dependent metalloprotease FtsH
MAIKTPQQNKKAGSDKSKKPGNGLISNLITALFIFLIIGALYSYVSDVNKNNAEIPLSQVASDVSAGKVASIVVSGEELEITYKAEQGKTAEVKKSKKEEGTAITETFAKYGIASTTLSSVSIDVKNESGFLYWFLNLAPFLLPILFVLFFLWYLSRQVKGAGMQAFTFGQSKARLTQPNDKKQRVTFNDVAGAKEAKEELKEIVDFLRSPKKFFDMGARIPKGILLMGAPGTGKCVTGETRISTNKGIVRIDEIPKLFSLNRDNTIDGLSVVSLNPKTTSFEKAVASHWYDLDEQDTKIIETGLGIKIEGTYEHPIVIVDEQTGDFVFKRLDEVKENDWVAVGYGNNLFGNYTKIPDPEVAYFLGVLIGDGGMTTKNRISLTTADSEILKKVQEISEKYFGTKFSKTSSRPYDYELRNVEAKAKLHEWGVEETYAEGKNIPDWINIAPKEYVAAFLRGLFDTDGCVEKTGAVSLSSASRSLIYDVHSTLLNMGIVARIYQRKKKYNNRNQFYINIYGDFVESFQQQIGFNIKRKKDRLQAVCLKQRNTNINVLPHQQDRIKRMWKNALETTEITLDREFYKQPLYKNIKRYINEDRMPSLSGMVTTLDKISDFIAPIKNMPEVQYLQRISSGQFFFTKINKIRNSRARVFDLTVPVLHNFIGSGFINHNTLLARATAGEANVAFFSISGSEFVEMFVGVGASRVRDLFAMAKASSPAIIFIDEIDAVGRTRGTGMGGGNDEREQTLNQILVEMDGFEPTEKVIVMAATNRPDVLDPAILRPGRFDRRVVIDLPDRGDREEILKIHGRGKPFAEDVNIALLAERTPGFSGADLYSLMNEGAILAAREGRNKIAQFDLIRAIEKVMLGPERKSHLLSVKEKEITAYHEAGHAIVASVLPYADPVHKISIISRGRAAGYTLKLPLEDRKLQSKNEFMDDIAMSLGGYITEKMIFGDVTTGPSNDLQVSTALARDMVTRYGMSDKIGAMALEGAGGKPLFGGQGMDGKEYSERMGAEIDSEVSLIMKTAYDKAEKIITEYKHVLDAIAKKLIEVETIEKDEYELLISAHGIPLKKKKDIEHQG